MSSFGSFFTRVQAENWSLWEGARKRAVRVRRKHAGYIAKTAVCPFQSWVGLCDSGATHISCMHGEQQKENYKFRKPGTPPQCASIPLGKGRLGSGSNFAEIFRKKHKLHVAKSFQKFGQVLLQAKSLGSKRCSMHLLLHLFGPIHKRKDQCIKLSGYLLHQTRKDFSTAQYDGISLSQTSGWHTRCSCCKAFLFWWLPFSTTHATELASPSGQPPIRSALAMLAFHGIELVAFPRPSHLARCFKFSL